MYLLLLACAVEGADTSAAPATTVVSGPRYDVRDFYCDGDATDPAEGDWSPYSTDLPLTIQALYTGDGEHLQVYDITEQLGMIPGQAPLVPTCQRDVPARYRLTVVYAAE